MKSLILTNKGIEEISSLEIKELTKAKILNVKERIVEIECTKEELIKLTYMGRTFNRTIEVLSNFSFKKIEDIEEKLPDFSKLVKKDQKIKVECERQGEHDFTSFEIENKIGNRIKEKYETKTDFKNPEIIIFVQIK